MFTLSCYALSAHATQDTTSDYSETIRMALMGWLLDVACLAIYAVWLNG